MPDIIFSNKAEILSLTLLKNMGKGFLPLKIAGKTGHISRNYVSSFIYLFVYFFIVTLICLAVIFLFDQH